MKTAFICLIALLSVGCAPPKPPELAAGQTWSVESRKGDGATTVTVLHLESQSPVGPVAVVSVNNVVVKLPDKRTVNGIYPVFITVDALKRSVTTFEFNQTKPLPFESHLALWRDLAKGVDSSKYVYTVPVKEALDLFEAGKTEPWAPDRSR
jgi:hypothetical protein